VSERGDGRQLSLRTSAAPYTRVRQMFHAWEAVGAGPTVLSWIRYGYRLPFVTQLKPFHHVSRVPTSLAERTELRAMLEKLLDIGVVVPATDTRFISRSRLEPKRDGGFRLIVDLRHVNSHLVNMPCSYETLADLQSIIRPDDWMISMDLEQGYYHVGIHAQHQRFITTEIDGQVVSFTALPFGLSTAPRVFTKFMRPFVKFVRQQGVRMLQYLDDSLFMAETREELLRTRDIVQSLLQELGLQRKPSKGHWEPTQSLTHLGIDIDTKAGVYSIPDRKQKVLVGAANSLLRYATSHRKWVSARKLSNLAGMAVSLTVAFPMARTLTRSIYDALGQDRTLMKDVRISDQCLQDISTIVNLDQLERSRPIWPPIPTATVTTDASDTGWGAVLNDAQLAQGFFEGDSLHWHISAKELWAVFLALQQFLDTVRNRNIMVVTDNMTVRAILSKGVSSSPQLMDMYRTMAAFCSQNNIHVQARYIPTGDNKVADALSRIDPRGEWQVSREIFNMVQNRFGRFTIDRFAAPGLATTERYNSVIPAHNSQGDAFESTWNNPRERSWLCPPIGLVSRVVDKLRQEGEEAVLVAPYWPTATWYPSLRQLMDQFMILSPSETHRHVLPSGPGPPDIWKNHRWRLMLAHVPMRANLCA